MGGMLVEVVRLRTSIQSLYLLSAYITDDDIAYVVKIFISMQERIILQHF